VRSLAILGPQGSGKSTIAALFEEHRGYQRHGIADALKHIASMSRPGLVKTEMIKVRRYFGSAEITGREYLQDLGAALRGVDVDFLMNAWQQDFEEFKRHGYAVVVDDVRLDAEVKFLRGIDQTFFVVRLSASPDARAERMGGALYGAADITERGWTDSTSDLSLDTTHLTAEEAYRRITDAMEG